MSILYTIGHSTHTLDDFAALLLSNDVDLLVDVRTYPGSRHTPQFNKETLPDALDAFGIEYVHMPALGGRRHHVLEKSPNTWWDHPAFRSYADYANTEPFAAGLQGLLGLLDVYTPAIMCSEAVWWKCHRRIITDYALAANVDVRHIMADGHTEPAMLSTGAHVLATHVITYPSKG